MCIFLMITITEYCFLLIKLSLLVIKLNPCFLKSSWHLSYSSHIQIKGKEYLDPEFDLLPLHSNPLFHNVSFIHEISLINQKVRYLLTNADYSESLKCVNIIHPCDY